MLNSVIKLPAKRLESYYNNNGLRYLQQGEYDILTVLRGLEELLLYYQFQFEVRTSKDCDRMKFGIMEFNL